ncbi:MAG: LytTR family DNA-binding domain-containing protein [Flavobacteriaceae bacterium]
MGKRDFINYDFFRNGIFVLLGGISIGLVQMLFFFVYRKDNMYLARSFGSADLFLRDIVVDRIIIESFSVFILIVLVLLLERFGWRSRIPENMVEYFGYHLKYLPVILVSLLIFTPLGIFLRYIWRKGFAFTENPIATYFANFPSIYVLTLLPFLFVSYLLLNLNLLNQKKRWVRSPREKEPEIPGPMDKLEVVNEIGNSFIDIKDILWIEKKDRVYIVKTNERMYYVRKSLNELGTYLAPYGFIRINRSVLANEHYIHNYSFWEYDKFILRMRDEQKTEFIVSRDRIKKIKSLLIPKI